MKSAMRTRLNAKAPLVRSVVDLLPILRQIEPVEFKRNKSCEVPVCLALFAEMRVNRITDNNSS